MSKLYGATALTPAAARILSMPVIFTPEAWQQAVNLESVDELADIEDRLCSTLAAAYKAVFAAPSDDVVDFGLHRLPPDGNPHQPLWLDLQASHQDGMGSTAQLLISLKPNPVQLAA